MVDNSLDLTHCCSKKDEGLEATKSYFCSLLLSVDLFSIIVSLQSQLFDAFPLYDIHLFTRIYLYINIIDVVLVILVLAVNSN